MWQYDKKLQYPVNIKNSNPQLAKVIISQLGGFNCKKIYCISQENKHLPYPAVFQWARCFCYNIAIKPYIKYLLKFIKI